MGCGWSDRGEGRPLKAGPLPTQLLLPLPALSFAYTRTNRRGFYIEVLYTGYLIYFSEEPAEMDTSYDLFFTNTPRPRSVEAPFV